jgi:hypothetical protein
MKVTEDLNKVFFGSEVSEKIKQLRIGLLLIEEKYIEYFKKRPSKFKMDNFDRLHNHYIRIINSNTITFGFTAESDLDEKIKNECIILFNEIFNQEQNNSERNS